MKNAKRIITLIAIVMVVCTLGVSLVACNDDRDPEKRPFSMSIGNPDGVFNPFFSTSAYDSSIIGMTQIGMLSTDKKGEIVVGENEPTVAKNYNVTENKDTNGVTQTTTYDFLIKKGIKWSDGEDLTIKDVLFSLYVYLDPAYTGSATIYSTDIVGLQNYRMQQPGNITDDAVSSFDEMFMTRANIRIQDLINYVGINGVYSGSAANKPVQSDLSEYFAGEEQALLDIAVVAREFYNELTTDWNAINVEDYKDWEGFKQPWQIFLLNDGGMTELLKRKADGTYDKVQEWDAKKGEYVDTSNMKMDTDEANSIYNINIQPELDKLNLNQNDSKYDEKLADAIKNICIDMIFGTYFPEFPTSILKNDADKFELSDDDLDAMYEFVTGLGYADFAEVIQSWATASTIFERFRADEKSKVLSSSDGQKDVPNVSGITTKKVTSFKGINDEITQQLDGEYDVLSITINKVDPKAIYNFSFTVSPMHYYSGTWNGKDYIDAANKDFAQNGQNGMQSEFGVEFGNSTFMQEVVNATSKVRLPIGAGAYMASTEKGGRATDGSQFFSDNMVYYERNPYFYTVGAELENAKIKTVRYKVVSTDQIVNSLASGNIDFGDPSATDDNIQQLKGAGLETQSILTSGYGYVGINPRFVPDVTVRRAIMKAMNKDIIIDNYYKGNATLIDRPISKASWVYPKDGFGTFSVDGVSYTFDPDGDDIEKMIKEAGYTKGSDGVYQRTIPGFGVDKLDYKFTIAGGSTDHPAYDMFLRAATILNNHGFNVKVVTSQTALTDLSAGKLEVWAAAWSSTIDPDMYQTYHMESQASSVKNWGYSQIIGRKDSSAWSDEYDIIVELSAKIDAGRATTDQKERTGIYTEALDLIMELACEFPTYQRNDLFAYKSGLLDPSTLPSEDDLGAYYGLLSRIWEINYVK